MESREEEQTVELGVEQGRKSLAQPTCGSARAAQDTESSVVVDGCGSGLRPPASLR
jgi:hypothetical protein